jgi:undecaprenyl-diphosphatase
MMYFEALILAVVEGITEFLPISSTGHLLLTAQILKIQQTDFVKSFEIVIQLGAILAVVVFYGRQLLRNWQLWKTIGVAFVPTAVVGLFFYDFIKDVLLSSTYITVIALFIGGIVLLVLEKFYTEKEHHIETLNTVTYKQAFLIGCIQSLSIVPGVSRAAATISGGLLAGLKRKAAVEFSFLLAVPTMVAASGLDFLKSGFSLSTQENILLLLGFIGAFVTALLAIKYFIRFIQHHTFVPFAIYRIVLAVIFWLVFI